MSECAEDLVALTESSDVLPEKQKELVLRRYASSFAGGLMGGKDEAEYFDYDRR